MIAARLATTSWLTRGRGEAFEGWGGVPAIDPNRLWGAASFHRDCGRVEVVDAGGQPPWPDRAVR
jgi:hypothetical protein